MRNSNNRSYSGWISISRRGCKWDLVASLNPHWAKQWLQPCFCSRPTSSVLLCFLAAPWCDCLCGFFFWLRQSNIALAFHTAFIRNGLSLWQRSRQLVTSSKYTCTVAVWLPQCPMVNISRVTQLLVPLFSKYCVLISNHPLIQNCGQKYQFNKTGWMYWYEPTTYQLAPTRFYTVT